MTRDPIGFLPADRFVGFALPGVLDAARSGALIGALAARGFAPTGAGYPRDYRDNDRLVFDDRELAAQLFARVGVALPREVAVDGVAWRLDDGRVIEAGRQLARLDRPARALALLPSGALLVGTSDGMIHRLDGTDHVRWPAHAGAVTSLAVSPTGDWASSAEDGTVKRWRADTLARTVPARDDFVTSVVFSPDGALIATGYDGVIWQDVCG